MGVGVGVGVHLGGWRVVPAHKSLLSILGWPLVLLSLPLAPRGPQHTDAQFVPEIQGQAWGRGPSRH